MVSTRGLCKQYSRKTDQTDQTSQGITSLGITLQPSTRLHVAKCAVIHQLTSALDYLHVYVNRRVRARQVHRMVILTYMYLLFHVKLHTLIKACGKTDCLKNVKNCQNRDDPQGYQSTQQTLDNKNTRQYELLILQTKSVPPSSIKLYKNARYNTHSIYMFFYKHGVFQFEAQICLTFSQIQPQNMLKICLSKNTQKSKFHDLTYA